MRAAPRDTAATARPLSAVMLRPRSLALLVLAIGIAVAFAMFGQWQLGRAVQNGAIIARPTEQVLALQSVARPEEFTTSAAAGQLVTASGGWVSGDFAVLRDRIDQGRSGYWTVGHFRTGAGDSLAVALGWASDAATAQKAADQWNGAAIAQLPAEVTGRYQPGEAPTPPAKGQTLAAEFSPAALINQWREPGPAYAGYVTLRAAPEGLRSIDSPPEQVQVQLNLLNLFYALEWVLFSVAALYIWYRLMRDVYEKERDGADAEGETPPLP